MIDLIKFVIETRAIWSIELLEVNIKKAHHNSHVTHSLYSFVSKNQNAMFPYVRLLSKMCSYYINLSNKILLCHKNLVFLENDKKVLKK